MSLVITTIIIIDHHHHHHHHHHLIGGEDGSVPPLLLLLLTAGPEHAAAQSTLLKFSCNDDDHDDDDNEVEEEENEDHEIYVATYIKTSLQQFQDVANPINALVSYESYSTTPWPSPAIRATISIELPLDGEDRAEGRVLGEMASGDALPHRLSPTPHQPSPDTAKPPLFIPSKSRESNCVKTFCFTTFQLYPKCFQVPSMHLQIMELQLSPKSPNA